MTLLYNTLSSFLSTVEVSLNFMAAVTVSSDFRAKENLSLLLLFPLLFAMKWWGSEVKVKVTQSCLTLCNLMDYKVHGILQARLLEWVAFPFSRGSSKPRDQTQVSHIAGGFFFQLSH